MRLAYAPDSVTWSPVWFGNHWSPDDISEDSGRPGCGNLPRFRVSHCSLTWVISLAALGKKALGDWEPELLREGVALGLTWLVQPLKRTDTGRPCPFSIAAWTPFEISASPGLWLNTVLKNLNSLPQTTLWGLNLSRKSTGNICEVSTPGTSKAN